MGHRLAESSSLYLRTHADNPVDWFPWGSAAFEEARRRDVPVFVSIGYAACHWCHVMARESFEDEAVAAELNKRFVAIKVDREEHPDVDDTYMAATQAMTGQGGWPMSVFTLPDGRVFHAGTYFPPRRMGQVPSFSEVLQAVDAAWTQRRAEVEDSAAKIAASLGAQRRQQASLATVVQAAPDPAQDPAQSSSAATLDAAELAELTAEALAVLAEQEDTVHGGFGSAPKFPPSPLLGLLLEEGAWDPESPAAGLALRTLEAMGRSALFDQVEGGFARYATDKAWTLPHFEKMLYDNSQLLGHCARLSVHPAADDQARHHAERQARMSIDWLFSRMLLEDSGLLASSLDADTVDAQGHHAEGATYLFSDAELREAAAVAGLDESQAAQLASLNRGVPADEHALARGGPLDITEQTPRTLHFDQPLTGAEADLWEQVLPELRRRRSLRDQPARDEKVVAAWNAQAIASLAQAAALWDDAELLERTQALAERLWEIHVEVDGERARVHRISYGGQRAEAVGGLSDHAHLALACFQLSSAGAGRHWVDRGASVLREVLESFVRRTDGKLEILESAETAGLLAAAQEGPLLATPLDSPEPSSVAALAQALQVAESLELLTDDDAAPPAPHDAAGPVRLGADALRPAEILQHVKVAAGKVPTVVGASLLAARRAARSSPAFRFIGGGAADLAQVRQAGALYGVPVEPVPAEAVAEGSPLRLSVCLNAVDSMICLPAVDSLHAALEKLRA